MIFRPQLTGVAGGFGSSLLLLMISSVIPLGSRNVAAPLRPSGSGLSGDLAPDYHHAAGAPASNSR